AVLRNVFEDPRFSVTRRTPWALVRHVGPLAVRARVPESLLRALLLPAAALRRVDRFTRDFSKALELPAGASSRQRLEHAEKVLGGAFLIAPSILPLPAVGFALLALAGKLLGGRERRGDLQPVLRGLPNNITTEMDLDLWQLATELRADSEARRMLEEQPPAVLARKFAAGELAAAAQSGLARFLGAYGHRAVAEIDVGMPRWRDDPTHILGVLANYLRLEDPDLAPDRQFRRARAEAEAQIARLVAEATAKGRFRGAVVRAALRRARLFIGLRERPKYQIVLALAEVRRQLAEVGKDLAGLGRIARADDVFFLNFADVERSLDGTGMQDLVARRQGAYYLELERRHIPRMLLSDGTEPETLLAATADGTASAGAAADGTLAGSPASAGTVTAAARVILDPVGAHLEPGEILVAPSTDPGWTPLFLTAGGLVMEMGGPNSHGAVVAREYGIPAVVGVPDATTRLRTGQKVTVDGGAGTVVPGS
ncbi:MAG: PEP-utilizing enzyme, partial [Actinomycetota bacterium]|nr:PEP-utilizing enzyme [Actinomycetota bacterium]